MGDTLAQGRFPMPEPFLGVHQFEAELLEVGSIKVAFRSRRLSKFHTLRLLSVCERRLCVSSQPCRDSSGAWLQ